MSNKLNEAVMHEICIRNVPSSNLNRDTDYPKVFSGSPLSLLTSITRVPQSRLRPLPSTSCVKNYSLPSNRLMVTNRNQPVSRLDLFGLLLSLLFNPEDGVKFSSEMSTKLWLLDFAFQNILFLFWYITNNQWFFDTIFSVSNISGRSQWLLSKAWTVFARWNTGIVGSNPTGGMDACVRLFCV
jgi:hypothetical protein